MAPIDRSSHDWPPGTHSSGDPKGSLPFTGLELGALAILGAGLIGVGIALHVARSREQQG